MFPCVPCLIVPALRPESSTSCEKVGSTTTRLVRRWRNAARRSNGARLSTASGTASKRKTSNYWNLSCLSPCVVSEFLCCLVCVCFPWRWPKESDMWIKLMEADKSNSLIVVNFEFRGGKDAEQVVPCHIFLSDRLPHKGPLNSCSRTCRRVNPNVVF